jgi:hypothetical protein
MPRRLFPATLMFTLALAACGRPYEPGSPEPEASPGAGAPVASTSTPPAAPAEGADAGVDGGEASDGGPPVDCASLDEAGCHAQPSCRPDYCYACNAFAPVWNGCHGVDEPGSPCPAFPGCSCAGLDEVTCTQTPSCHAVYQSFACAIDCKKAPCCSPFVRCVDGAKADCNGDDARCDITPPYCEPPLVVAVNDVCYEGCVYPGVCQP